MVGLFLSFFFWLVGESRGDICLYLSVIWIWFYMFVLNSFVFMFVILNFYGWFGKFVVIFDDRVFFLVFVLFDLGN